jgi:peptide deformylase
MVERPLRIDVEHQTLAGELRVITFERGAARLWAHEIDHLRGTLYVDRMHDGSGLVATERYTGTGEAWRY